MTKFIYGSLINNYTNYNTSKENFKFLLSNNIDQNAFRYRSRVIYDIPPSSSSNRLYFNSINQEECPPFGACCINNTCTPCSWEECMSNSGVYFGDYTSCFNISCVTTSPTTSPPTSPTTSPLPSPPPNL